MDKPPLIKELDLNVKIDSADVYQKQLKDLQDRFTKQQNATFHNSERVVILLEGWDAAGKGGAIRRMVEKLDPRSFRVHPIGKPNDLEARQHYLQRFWERLPPRGHIAIFDRSWYGRVLVERVEAFAKKDEWRRAYAEINDFEKQLSDDGVVIIKLLLHISQEEQLERFAERLDNPYKHWKLTDEDLRNREKASEYLAAYQDMLDSTHTEWAPWTLVAGEYKWHARLAVLETVVSTLEKRIKGEIPHFSAKEIRAVRKKLGLNDKG
ncbi:MAG: polyphosphate kinase [Porticoccaceae bacterium]|nr:polyphosphate kinase [Porticoccaceae bacterium]